MKKIVILVTDGVQDEEFIYPYYRLKEESEIDLHVLTPDGQSCKGKYGIPIRDIYGSFQWLINDEYDAVIIPGGWECPEKLRMDTRVTEFLKRMNKNSNRLIAAICHGPQVLISAQILKDRHITAYAGIADDIKNAGAIFYKDHPVIADYQEGVATIITSPHYKHGPQWIKHTIDSIMS